MYPIKSLTYTLRLDSYHWEMQNGCIESKDPISSCLSRIPGHSCHEWLPDHFQILLAGLELIVYSLLRP